MLLQVQAGLLLELQAEVFVGACRVQLLDIGVLINNVSRELLEVEAGVLLEGDTLSRYRRRLVTELVLGASLGCTELRLPRVRCIPSAFTRILRILLRLGSLLLLLVEEVDMARGSGWVLDLVLRICQVVFGRRSTIVLELSIVIVCQVVAVGAR